MRFPLNLPQMEFRHNQTVQFVHLTFDLPSFVRYTNVRCCEQQVRLWYIGDLKTLMDHSCREGSLAFPRHNMAAAFVNSNKQRNTTGSDVSNGISLKYLEMLSSVKKYTATFHQSLATD